MGLPGGVRDVHAEHESIFLAAMARQEARAALALEAHIRLTCDILTRQAAAATGGGFKAALNKPWISTNLAGRFRHAGLGRRITHSEAT